MLVLVSHIVALCCYVWLFSSSLQYPASLMLVLFKSLHRTPGMSCPLCTIQFTIPYIGLQLPQISYLTTSWSDEAAGPVMVLVEHSDCSLYESLTVVVSHTW